MRLSRCSSHSEYTLSVVYISLTYITAVVFHSVKSELKLDLYGLWQKWVWLICRCTWYVLIKFCVSELCDSSWVHLHDFHVKWINVADRCLVWCYVVLCSEFPLRLFSAVVTLSNVIFRRGLAKPVATTASTVPSSTGLGLAVRTTPKRVTLK